MLIFKFFFGGILHLYERIFSLSGKSFDLNVNLFPVTSVSYFDSYNKSRTQISLCLTFAREIWVRYFLTKITLFFSKVRRQMSARGSSSLVWNHVDIEWSSCYGHSDRNNRHSFNRIRCRRALHIPVWHQG